MIPAAFYQEIYLAIVGIITMVCYFRYYKARTAVRESVLPGLVLAVFMVVFIGLRPIAFPEFGDMSGYAWYHDAWLHKKWSFDWDTENVIFDNLIQRATAAKLGIRHTGLFVIIAAIYFLVRYWSTVKFFPRNSLMAYLVFLGAFLTFTSSTNGMKAGIASSCFVLALAYWRNWKVAGILLLITWGLHHAFFPCAVAFVGAYFYRNTKVYLGIWFVALIIAALHITFFQELFASAGIDKKAEEYLNVGDKGYRTGFRIDFVIYSFMPILLGWYMMVKKGFKSVEFSFLLNVYLILNAVWLMCMYASYTNRIAAMSWAIIPVLLCYPFLSERNKAPAAKKNRNLAVVSLLNLGFTVFMVVIYYAIIHTNR